MTLQRSAWHLAAIVAFLVLFCGQKLVLSEYSYVAPVTTSPYDAEYGFYTRSGAAQSMPNTGIRQVVIRFQKYTVYDITTSSFNGAVTVSGIVYYAKTYRGSIYGWLSDVANAFDVGINIPQCLISGVNRRFLMVNSVNHASGTVGVYFNYWRQYINLSSDDTAYFVARNSRSGTVDQIVAWSGKNGGSDGDSHGRYNGGACCAWYQHYAADMLYETSICGTTLETPKSAPPRGTIISNIAQASGGAISTIADWTIHKFTSTGTFTFRGTANVEVLVIGGGGGGGVDAAGGGGGGGYLYDGAYPLVATSYSVYVGAGGSRGANTSVNGNRGTNSYLNNPKTVTISTGTQLSPSEVSKFKSVQAVTPDFETMNFEFLFTRPSSSGWRDFALYGATDSCGGWFMALNGDRPYFGTQCNWNSQGAVNGPAIPTNKYIYSGGRAKLRFYLHIPDGLLQMYLNDALWYSYSIPKEFFFIPSSYLTIGAGNHAGTAEVFDGLIASWNIWCTRNMRAVGGGGGSSRNTGERGKYGGSGGGQGHVNGDGPGRPVPGQGNWGGYHVYSYSGGGGGGAGCAGGNASTTVGGTGGCGRSFDITGAPEYYAGGGGGGNHAYSAGVGQHGGGNGGGRDGACRGYDGAANTGGGGGANGNNGCAGGISGNGGSGVVIIRYKREVTSPPVLALDGVSANSLKLTWLAPNAATTKACIIQAYTVLITQYNPAGSSSWNAAGCVNISATSCIATGLAPGYYYQYRVMAICTISTYNSDWSEWSNLLRLRHPADAPIPLTPTHEVPSASTLLFRFTPGRLNECQGRFQYYRVYLNTGAQYTTTNTFVKVGGLAANTVYSHRVMTQCSLREFSSVYSAYSVGTATNLAAATPTVNITPTKGPTAASMLVFKWVANAANGCSLKSWNVLFNTPTNGVLVTGCKGESESLFHAQFLMNQRLANHMDEKSLYNSFNTGSTQSNLFWEVGMVHTTNPAAYSSGSLVAPLYTDSHRGDGAARPCAVQFSWRLYGGGYGEGSDWDYNSPYVAEWAPMWTSNWEMCATACSADPRCKQFVFQSNQGQYVQSYEKYPCYLMNTQVLSTRGTTDNNFISGQCGNRNTQRIPLSIRAYRGQLNTSSYQAANAIDTNSGTPWVDSVLNGHLTAWIEVNLGAAATVKGFRFRQYPGVNDRVTHINILLSNGQQRLLGPFSCMESSSRVVNVDIDANFAGITWLRASAAGARCGTGNGYWGLYGFEVMGIVSYGRPAYNFDTQAGNVFPSITSSTGSAASAPLDSCRDYAGTTTRWLKNNHGYSSLRYCWNCCGGYGWTQFASAPGGATWFGGDTKHAWSLPLKNIPAGVFQYDYGTPSLGGVGDFWQNLWTSKRKPIQVMFMTGNNAYWTTFDMSYMDRDAGDGLNSYATAVSSNNFGTTNRNRYVSVTFKRSVAFSMWGWNFYKVLVMDEPTNSNILHVCQGLGMLPVCDHPAYANGACYNMGGYTGSLHFSYPPHSRSFLGAWSTDILDQAYFYTAHHGTGSLQMITTTHRWRQGGEYYKYTFCNKPNRTEMDSLDPVVQVGNQGMGVRYVRLLASASGDSWLQLSYIGVYNRAGQNGASMKWAWAQDYHDGYMSCWGNPFIPVREPENKGTGGCNSYHSGVPTSGWWVVDLGVGGFYDTYRIRIRNRNDCCQYRFSGALIQTYDSEWNLLWQAGMSTAQVYDYYPSNGAVFPPVFWAEASTTLYNSFKSSNGGIKVFFRTGGNGLSSTDPATSCRDIPTTSSGTYWIMQKQQPEIFYMMGNNSGYYTANFEQGHLRCRSVGARMATYDEFVNLGWAKKAQWCACGWTTNWNTYYPMNYSPPETISGGCGGANNNVRSCGRMALSGVICYGIKPPPGTTGVLSFNPQYYNAPGQTNQPAPVQKYCEMSVNGGGWQSFASAPGTGNWFTGDTGKRSWLGLQYSYGTYPTNGVVGNYWDDYFQAYEAPDEIMFKTGNGKYWASMPMSAIRFGGEEIIGTWATGMSGNMGAVNTNFYVCILFRAACCNEDPWINMGYRHAESPNFMFWGEDASTVHLNFKNQNDGIVLYHRSMGERAHTVYSGMNLKLVQEGPMSVTAPINLAMTNAYYSYVYNVYSGYSNYWTNDGRYGQRSAVLGNTWGKTYLPNNPTSMVGYTFYEKSLIRGIAWGSWNSGEASYCDWNRPRGYYKVQYSLSTASIGSLNWTEDEKTGWKTLGAVNLNREGGEGFMNLCARHRYSFDPVEAWHVRVYNYNPYYTIYDEVEVFGEPIAPYINPVDDVASFFANKDLPSTLSYNYYFADTGITQGGSFSISFWMKSDLMYYQTVLGVRKQIQSGPWYGIQMDTWTNGQICMYTAAPNTWTINPCGPAGTIVRNRWNHVVYTFSSRYTGTLYVNGVVKQQQTGTGWLQGWDGIVIGGCGHNCRGYNGFLKDLRIYNRLLSADDVKAMWEARAPENANVQTTVSCTATGLSPGIGYRFYVQRVCKDPSTQGAVSGVSPYGYTLAKAGQPGTPTVINAPTAGANFLIISWADGTIGDCVHKAWLVEFVAGGTGTPPGCRNLAGKVVSFIETGEQSWTCPIGVTSVQVLVVGGGGAGANNNSGGGGAGGVIYSAAYAVAPKTTYKVIVGAGGLGQTTAQGYQSGGKPWAWQNGGNSVFGTITALGGGGGSGWCIKAWGGASGGSGAGAGACSTSCCGSSIPQGGAGTAGQGNRGGNGALTTIDSGGGGGGGAGGPGVDAVNGGSRGEGGVGGPGVQHGITGTMTYYGAGGGGGGGGGGWGGDGGLGQVFPAGHGGANVGPYIHAVSAAPNTGNGGGGGDNSNGGNGGSGIVVLRYAVGGMSCTATSLTPGITYSFKVTRLCDNSDTNSPVSATSNTRQVLRPATAPVMGVPKWGVPATEMMILSWTPGTLNNCVFKSWDVRFETIEGADPNPANKIGEKPAGCTSFPSRSSLYWSCTASGLMMGVSYSFSVQEHCTDPSLNSPGGKNFIPLKLGADAAIGGTSAKLDWVKSNTHSGNGIYAVDNVVDEQTFDFPDGLTSATAADSCSSIRTTPAVSKAYWIKEAEVFHVRSKDGAYKMTYSEAEALCKSYDAVLATREQVNKAHDLGADWCSWGWISDGTLKFPATTSLSVGCGGSYPGVRTMSAISGTLADANCWGRKPVAGTPYISNFHQGLLPRLIRIETGPMDAGCYSWNNPVQAGDPLPQEGAGMIVGPAPPSANGAYFSMHDHVYITTRVPNPDRAFVKYTYNVPVKISQIVIRQHQNGIDQIELYSDNTSCGIVRGKSTQNGAWTAAGIALQENVEYVYTGFSAACPAGTDIKVVVRSTSLVNGYAVYRIIPSVVSFGPSWHQPGVTATPNGGATQAYCDMATNGGGWQLFAQTNTGINTCNTQQTWKGLTYNCGTYVASGAQGYNFFKSTYNAFNEAQEVMFKTGNGKYWWSFPLSEIRPINVYDSEKKMNVAFEDIHTVKVTASSMNTGIDEENRFVTIHFRKSSRSDWHADPLIIAGGVSGRYHHKPFVRYARVQTTVADWLQFSWFALYTQDDVNIAYNAYCWTSSNHGAPWGYCKTPITGAEDKGAGAGNSWLPGTYTTGQWWAIDLTYPISGKTYAENNAVKFADINRVVVRNRVDCCQNRLQNVRVILYSDEWVELQSVYLNANQVQTHAFGAYMTNFKVIWSEQYDWGRQFKAANNGINVYFRSRSTMADRAFKVDLPLLWQAKYLEGSEHVATEYGQNPYIIETPFLGDYFSVDFDFKSEHLTAYQTAPYNCIFDYGGYIHGVLLRNYMSSGGLYVKWSTGGGEYGGIDMFAEGTSGTRGRWRHVHLMFSPGRFEVWVDQENRKTATWSTAYTFNPQYYRAMRFGSASHYSREGIDGTYKNIHIRQYSGYGNRGMGSYGRIMPHKTATYNFALPGFPAYKMHVDMDRYGGGWVLVATVRSRSCQAHMTNASVRIVDNYGPRLDSYESTKMDDAWINRLFDLRTRNYGRFPIWMESTGLNGGGKWSAGQAKFDQFVYLCSSFDLLASASNQDCRTHVTRNWDRQETISDRNPNTGTRGLGDHHTSAGTYFAWGRHPEQGTNCGFREDRLGSSDGYLWVQAADLAGDFIVTGRQRMVDFVSLYSWYWNDRSYDIRDVGQFQSGKSVFGSTYVRSDMSTWKQTAVGQEGGASFTLSRPAEVAMCCSNHVTAGNYPVVKNVDPNDLQYTLVKTPSIYVGPHLTGSGVNPIVDINISVKTAIEFYGLRPGYDLYFIQHSGGKVYYYGAGTSSGLGGTEMWTMTQYKPLSTWKVQGLNTNNADYTVGAHGGKPCTFWATTLPAGSHQVGCWGTWGSGVFINNSPIQRPRIQVERINAPNIVQELIAGLSVVRGQTLWKDRTYALPANTVTTATFLSGYSILGATYLRTTMDPYNAGYCAAAGKYPPSEFSLTEPTEASMCCIQGGCGFSAAVLNEPMTPGIPWTKAATATAMQGGVSCHMFTATLTPGKYSICGSKCWCTGVFFKTQREVSKKEVSHWEDKEDWEYCANEGQTCYPQPAGRVFEVRYGLGDQWSTIIRRFVAGSVPCNNAQFGDPSPGPAKICQYRPERGIIYCANEGGTCSCPYGQVRFGREHRFSAWRAVTSTIVCNTANFGTPSDGGRFCQCTYNRFEDAKREAQFIVDLGSPVQIAQVDLENTDGGGYNGATGNTVGTLRYKLEISNEVELRRSWQSNTYQSLWYPDIIFIEVDKPYTWAETKAYAEAKGGRLLSRAEALAYCQRPVANTGTWKNEFQAVLNAKTETWVAIDNDNYGDRKDYIQMGLPNNGHLYGKLFRPVHGWPAWGDDPNTATYISPIIMYTKLNYDIQSPYNFVLDGALSWSPNVGGFGRYVSNNPSLYRYIRFSGLECAVDQGSYAQNCGLKEIKVYTTIEKCKSCISTLLRTANIADPPAIISTVIGVPAASSIVIRWAETVPNGCKFSSWVVQFNSGGTVGAIPTGCEQSILSNYNQIMCTAGGLTSGVAYSFKIQEACTVAAANSKFSVTPSVTTYRAATAPVSLSVSNVAPAISRLQLTWNAGTQNNCSFSAWKVVFKGTNTVPNGCSGLINLSSRICYPSLLSTGTSYEFTVQQLCTDSSLNSPLSAASVAKATLLPAGTPTMTIPVNIVPAASTLSVTWAAGAQNGCVHSYWEILFTAGRAGVPLGCEASRLTNRATLLCTASGLAMGTSYSFSVQEFCADDSTNSVLSTPAGVRATLVKSATPMMLATVWGPNTSLNSLIVKWQKPSLNSCSLSRWKVTFQAGGSINSEPVGCTAITDSVSSQPSCTATGLSSGTIYAFNVQALCTDGSLDSSISAKSVSLATAVKAATSSAVTAEWGPDAVTQLVVSWAAGAVNSCTHANWDVRFGAGSPVAKVNAVVTGCTGLTTSSDAKCTATGLVEGTDYSFYVSRVCVDTNQNSLVSATSTPLAKTAVPAPTPKLGTPQWGTPSTSVLDLTWVVGGLGACVFKSWEVQFVTGGVPGTTVTACQDAVKYNANARSCSITGLTGGVSYSFKMMRRCTVESIDSDWSDVSASKAPAIKAEKISGIAAQPSVPAISTMEISWQAGAMQGCVFKSWAVLFVTGGISGVAPAGCDMLYDSSAAKCTATGLATGTSYSFTVERICTDLATNSGVSPTSISLIAAKPAETPVFKPMVWSIPSVSTMLITWDPKTINGCEFLSWEVLFAGGTGVDINKKDTSPDGCDNLKTESTTMCTASGLDTDMGYQFTIQRKCTDASTDSAVTAPSTEFKTALKSTNPGTPVAVSVAPAATALKVTWPPGLGNGCVFKSWQVNFATKTDAVVGCDTLSTESLAECTATGLQSGSPYQFKVRRVCLDISTSSLFSLVSITTVTKVPAITPQFTAVALNPADRTKSLVLTWEKGYLNGCVFAYWKVDYKTGNTGAIKGCLTTELTDSSILSCTGKELLSGVTVSFTVQAVCQDASTNSAVSGPSIDVTTDPNYGAPSKLRFSLQPSTEASASKVFAQQPVVEVADDSNSRVMTSTQEITLNIKEATGTAGANLLGTYTLYARFGAATFTDLAIDTFGSGYILEALGGALTGAQSTTIDVKVGAPFKLMMKQQPSTFNTLKELLMTQPIICIVDEGENLITDSVLSVTVAIKAGTGTAAVGGTLVVAAVGGIVTFTNLQIDGGGQAMALEFTCGNLLATESSPIDVERPAGSPAALYWAQWTAEGQIVATQTIKPAMVVQVQDSNGVTVTGASLPVTVSLKPSAVSLRSKLGGTTIVASANGVASFEDLTIDMSGDDYVLVASADGLPDVESSPFNVGLGDASKLTVKTDLSLFNTIGRVMVVQPVVGITDLLGNVVESTAYPVTASLKAGLGTGGAKLLGTTVVNAVMGLASFTDLQVDKLGKGYVIVFTAGSLNTTLLQSAESVAFAVQELVSNPTKCTFLVQPGGRITANTTFPVQPQIVLADDDGNVALEAEEIITMKIVADSGVKNAKLYGTELIAQESGMAAYSNLQIDLMSSGYKLEASVVGKPEIASCQSEAFEVKIGDPSQLRFRATPKEEEYKITFGTQPVVEITDAAGNLIETASTTTTLRIKEGTGQYRAKLIGKMTQRTELGKAVYADMYIDGYSTVTNYQLAAVGTVNVFDIPSNKTKAVVISGNSPIFTVYTKADKLKALFTPGQQVAEDPAGSLEAVMNNPSMFYPALFMLLCSFFGLVYMGWKLGYCRKKTAQEKAAEAMMKKKQALDDPFSQGLGDILSDSSRGPEAMLSMQGIDVGDLDSILLNTIAGLEHVRGDLTLADLAELSMEEIEEIMDQLNEGNEEFEELQAEQEDLQEFIDNNPLAMSMEQAKRDMELDAKNSGGIAGSSDTVQDVVLPEGMGNASDFIKQHDQAVAAESNAGENGFLIAGGRRKEEVVEEVEVDNGALADLAGM